MPCHVLPFKDNQQLRGTLQSPGGKHVIHSLLRRLDYAIAINIFLPGKNGEGSLKIGIIFQIKMVEKNACIYLYHFISGMQVVYGYYMVVYRPYTVRIPH